MVSIASLHIFHLEILFLYEYLCMCILSDLGLLSHSLIQHLRTLNKMLSNSIGYLLFRSYSLRENDVYIYFGRASFDLFFTFYRYSYRFTSPSNGNMLGSWNKRWWDFWSLLLDEWAHFKVSKGLWENLAFCLDKHFNYCRELDSLPEEDSYKT